MKRLRFVRLAAGLAFLASSIAPVTAGVGKTAAGTVTAIATGSLSIQGSGAAKATQTFVLDDKTQVVARGATKATKGAGRGVVTDLIAKGDRVSVTYEEAAGSMHATEVRVTKKASAK